MKDSCDYPILGRKAEIADKPGKESHRQGERDEEILAQLDMEWVKLLVIQLQETVFMQMLATQPEKRYLANLHH